MARSEDDDGDDKSPPRTPDARMHQPEEEERGVGRGGTSERQNPSSTPPPLAPPLLSSSRHRHEEEERTQAALVPTTRTIIAADKNKKKDECSSKGGGGSDAVEAPDDKRRLSFASERNDNAGDRSKEEAGGALEAPRDVDHRAPRVDQQEQRQDRVVVLEKIRRVETMELLAGEWRPTGASTNANGDPTQQEAAVDYEYYDVEAELLRAAATMPGAVAVPGPAFPLSILSDGVDDDDEESPSPPVRPRPVGSGGRLERNGSATTTTTTMTTLTEGTSSLLVASVVQDDSDSDDNDNTNDDDDTNSITTRSHNHSSRSLRRERAKLEKIRSEILAAAAAADPVMLPASPETGTTKKRKLPRRGSRRSRRQRRTVVIVSIIIAVAIVAVVVVAVAVGVTVALSKSHHDHHHHASAPTPAPESDVVAVLDYDSGTTNRQGDDLFAESIHAEARGGSLFNVAAMSSTGTIQLINCQVKPCAGDAKNGTTLCVPGREYVPGCCLGSDCPNATQCGDVCPKPPDSCRLINPDNVTCTQAECYDCNSDLYELHNFAITIDCLMAGTSVRKSNGQVYKWAIACGPVEQGGLPHMNQAIEEYQCAAARIGAGYDPSSSGSQDGFLTNPVSCRYLALAECGCGPSDMNSFDLPMPTEECPVNGTTTCPFRCDDVGTTEARLCRAFPHNISWWEGTNALNRNWFDTGVGAGSAAAPSDSSLRIYVKEGNA